MPAPSFFFSFFFFLMELVRALWLESVGGSNVHAVHSPGQPPCHWELISPQTASNLEAGCPDNSPSLPHQHSQNCSPAIAFQCGRPTVPCILCLGLWEGGFFTGWGNTPSNCVSVFKHWAGELLLAQVSDREKFWLICNQEGSRVYCVLRIRDSRRDYSWKGCLLRAQCI